ncbi:hypothetical protein KP509_21G088000 [Ceratopteris richardii]|uniref:BED-type domain-containing protein n=1 Tax=Ceratopteris richardii TaxID=49495 RepID=A0A8T2SC77_CERRI|nr:hypothetical protein KP509_21G088000 [Ceratopteris richardii]
MPRGISPLWSIHTSNNELVNTTGSGSGTRRWMCKYCGKFFSTTTTRLIRHVSGLGGLGIAGCTQVPQEIAEIVSKEHKLAQDAKEARRREFVAASEDILEEVEDIRLNASTLRSRTSSQRDENEEFVPLEGQSSQRFKASQPSIQSSYISNAWKRMVKAIAQVGPFDDWHGVDYKRLRTSMLIEERERIEKLLDPIRLGWQTYGCSILSDGWNDIRRRHIINIMVSSFLGTFFLKTIDCSHAGTRITGELIFEHIKSAIEKIGVQNVVQVITDNASNCKRMGELVEAEFPRIVWTPCVAHCLDLLIEDIGKLPWLSPLVSDAKKVISFIRKNHQALAIFRAYSKKEGRTEAANFVQRKVFDVDFWAEIEHIVPVLIHILLRFADMEGSTLGLLYHIHRDVMELVESRWQFLSRPIHSFAALLHPYFKGPRLWSKPHMHYMKDLYMERIMSHDQHVAFDRDFSAYMTNVGIAYARSTSLMQDVTSRPLEWWNHYGYGHLIIAPHALRRNWSAFSLVRTKLRNCLSVEQLHRVVFCKANLRLLRSLRSLTGPR